MIYLLLYFVISSLTVGILRSRRIALLVTYQGASIRDLGVFDWKVTKMRRRHQGVVFVSVV